jgi:hypothetical protein
LRHSKLIRLEHLLFAAYLIVFAWLVTKVKFFANAGLTSSQLVIIFLLKVMAGILYGWIGVYYGEMAQMMDTWAYHYEALKEYHNLLNNPSVFFTDIFNNTYPDGYSRFLSEHSWWNDLKGNFFLKILALFDVLSFGHYYINVILYSFITLFGPLALYRVMQDVFPNKKIAVLLSTFLVPSFIYWTSGLHKEGIIFAGFAFIAFNFYFGLKEKNFTVRRILMSLFGFILVLGLRNFFIIPLIPGLIAWALASRLKQKPLVIFSAVYIFFIVLFFTAKYVDPRFNFPGAVVDKQQSFLKLTGASTIQVTQLKPTITSFLLNTPQAFSLTIVRPYPGDVHHLLSLAAAIEIDFLILLFIIFLFWRTNGTPKNPFILFCIFFSFSVLLMIGYSVNNLGAIVRYRSVLLPFLIVPLGAMINWQRVGRYFLGDIPKSTNITI